MAEPLIDFGKAADDYGRHRPGFPDEFFDRVRGYGIGVAGQRVLDLGTGTGTLTRGFALRGCRSVGLDPSPRMLDQARALDREAGVDIEYIEAGAEDTGLPSASFDVVCAGQCWHWFNRVQAAAEVKRLLRPRGFALIAYFTYLSDPGTVGAATEALVLNHNPTWPFAGSDGRAMGFADDLTAAGLLHLDTFEFDLAVTMSHEAWRGRLRACNGVLTLPPDTIVAFDADLAALLARGYPDPLAVPHRVFGIVAQKE
ncbi:MAG TPA: class I SAM-dependent methyltransferase [Candidatus Kryptonia bacterium]|nr:class I SAM-dependent methyltransferase [Candidatus Kryptonia bacterium]